MKRLLSSLLILPAALLARTHDAHAATPYTCESGGETVSGCSTGNSITGSSAASGVLSGISNTIVNGDDSTIAGGDTNNISLNASSAEDQYSFIGGGYENAITNAANDQSVACVISGGAQNVISGFEAYDSTIGGGITNKITSAYSTISGGSSNLASSNYATVTGGESNTASGYLSTVDGGQNNTASGANSFAAGTYARATYQGSFVWSDSTGSSSNPFSDTATNQFFVRATGGFELIGSSAALNVISTYGGLNVVTGLGPKGVTIGHNGTSWSSLSDRNAKKDITALDPDDVLERLMEAPAYGWTYKESEVPHMGPMAQDFKAAFGLGDVEDDKHIATQDIEGATFAAAQALAIKNKELEAKNARLEERLAELEKHLGALSSLETRLAALETK